MEHWGFTDEVKEAARVTRRLNAKTEIEHQLADAQLFWSVWRQDDYGRKHEIVRNLTRDLALQRAAELESHGHKQLYWIEQTI